MLVVDTNIIFPYFVEGELTAQVESLHEHDPVWHTEPFALVELSNALATYERAGHLTSHQAFNCLAEAEAVLAFAFVPVSPRVVLELSIRYRVSAYDAHFLAVAVALDLKLITEDRKLRTAAPRLTQSLAEALANF